MRWPPQAARRLQCAQICMHRWWPIPHQPNMATEASLASPPLSTSLRFKFPTAAPALPCLKFLHTARVHNGRRCTRMWDKLFRQLVHRRGPSAQACPHRPSAPRHPLPASSASCIFENGNGRSRCVVSGVWAGRACSHFRLHPPTPPFTPMLIPCRRT